MCPAHLYTLPIEHPHSQVECNLNESTQICSGSIWSVQVSKYGSTTIDNGRGFSRSLALQLQYQLANDERRIYARGAVGDGRAR